MISGFIGLFWLEKIVLENPYDVSIRTRFEVSDSIMQELGQIEYDAYLISVRKHPKNNFYTELHD